MSKKTSSVSFSKTMKSGVRQRLFNELNKTTRINEEGNVSWSGITDVDQLIEALGDTVDFPAEISRRERSAIVSRGIIDARKRGKISDSNVLEAVQRIVNQRFAEKPQKFAMWSRVSYRPSNDRADKLFAYADVSIRLSRSLPKCMHYKPRRCFRS